MNEKGLNELNRRRPQVHHAEPVGPQGAALILELQRIQRAFDQEFHPDQRGPTRQAKERGHGAHPRHPLPRREKRKGIMTRALGACLKGLGLGNTPAAEAGPTARTPAAAKDTRHPAPNRPPRPARSGADGLGLALGPALGSSRERDVRSLPANRPPRPPEAEVYVMPPRGRHAPPSGSGRPLGSEHAASRHVPESQRAPVPPGWTSIAKSLRSIGVKRLARYVGQELSRGRTLVEGKPADPDRSAAAIRLKSGLSRALETGAGHAKVAYQFLVTGEQLAADDVADGALATRIRRSFERELRTGLRVLVLGLAIVGIWGTLVPLSGAVVVPGSLVVQSDVKKVQHPTGGIVAQIPVHDGMHVNAGDLVVRLDETQARANLQMVSTQLDEVTIRIARLTAERDGLGEPKMPEALARRSEDEDVSARFASEESLFKARATARQGQKDLLQSRIVQLGQQIDGLEAQIKSNASQIDLIAGELQGVQGLFEKRLAPITRLNSLQRDSARLEGERGQLQSTIAETKSKIGETKLQLIRVDQDFRADVIKDLREAEAKQAELTERRVAAQDQLNRIDIRAATSGIVHQLAVHTVGGVIKAGEVVMEIVPDRDELQVEAHLPPNEIDQVRAGQSTFVRFTAFNQRTTPQLRGIVSYVSADLTRDQQSNTQSNASYYTVRVTLPEEEHRRLAGLQLVSGMPAEVFVQTGSRTMMSYLFKPITDQLRRAFNER